VLLKEGKQVVEPSGMSGSLRLEKLGQLEYAC
jgi:hypothetical protein